MATKNQFNEKMKISVRRSKTKHDPPVDIFSAEITNETGIWKERYGSENEMRAFLRGVQAGAQMCGHVVYPPPVPSTHMKVSNF